MSKILECNGFSPKSLPSLKVKKVSSVFSLSQNLLRCCCLLLLASGCASYGVVENRSIQSQSTEKEYSLKKFASERGKRELYVGLSFSGGGTRAAAMAYGVLLELRDTNVMLSQGSTRLLDAVESISSVSGGSFTAAYYGLHGDAIFEDYEKVFLRKNIESPLVHSLFNPLHWFSNKGRTERAVKYYQKNIFHGATYADMMKPGRPLIVINASDLAYGVRFSFVQEYFDLLCSDLRSFPIARAVTASSAVPVAFNPIVVQNYADCSESQLEWFEKIKNQADAEGAIELGTLVKGLESYLNKDQRKYIHLVDGGITDNIGLRAYYDILELSGGLNAFLKKNKEQPPERWVLITVDASTTPVYSMDETNKQPSMKESMSAMSGVQLHRYNAASIDLVKGALNKWSNTVNSAGHIFTPYFIEVSFANIKKSPLRSFLNTIPTSFFLEDEQVDTLIEAGRHLLRNNPDFQQFLADMKNS